MEVFGADKHPLRFVLDLELALPPPEEGFWFRVSEKGSRRQVFTDREGKIIVIGVNRLIGRYAQVFTPGANTIYTK